MTCVRATNPTEALATRPPAILHKFFQQRQPRSCRFLIQVDKQQRLAGLEQRHHEYLTTSVLQEADQQPTW